jgi:hypothetical protein
MKLNLLELRKYAIDHRVEIKFSDPQTAHECLIKKNGQVSIPGEDKDFRIEGVLDAAEMFVIIEDGGAKKFTREAMFKTVGDTSKGKAPTASAEEEE